MGILPGAMIAVDEADFATGVVWNMPPADRQIILCAMAKRMGTDRQAEEAQESPVGLAAKGEHDVQVLHGPHLGFEKPRTLVKFRAGRGITRRGAGHGIGDGDIRQ